MTRSTIDLPVDAIAEICRRHHVKELALFGSALRRDFRPNSDIDLLVEFQPEAQVGLLSLARTAEELSVILGREVDLVPKNGLKQAIRDEVLADTEVIFAA